MLAKILKVEGIVLYPFIFFAAKNPDNTIIKHELIHILQIKRIGFFSFYLSYIRQYLQFRFKGLGHYQSYRSISFEIEAYENQKNDYYHLS